jgi:pimeloyl-ACP methyl ester carboxylesterase
MWKTSEFQGDYIHWPVGSYFIKKLDEYQKQTGIKLTIDLVGHSAGSIVICELLKMITAKKYDIRFRNIIFMAPACRTDLFEDSIMKNADKFTSFRCFTMSDEKEKEDRMLDFVYPRSLLYLISGILESRSDDLILGLQRHTTGTYPYNDEQSLRIANFLKEEGHAVYAVTDKDAAEGFRSGALKHGAFDDEKESTLDSIIYIIKQ